MALPEFQDEQQFRNTWIAPFLAKLGFINIKNTHGPSEQGKDFYFTDYDRFGHSRYYAAQAKLGNIGNGSKEIAELLDQVKRCFGVRLRFHKGAHDQRISAVYVMATGTISIQARERIHDWCSLEHYGENVYFLDGEQLENKERFATYENDQEKRQHYSALYNETYRNQLLLKKQIGSFQEKIAHFSIYRMTALDLELRRIPINDGLTGMAATMERAWHQMANYNSLDVDYANKIQITHNSHDVQIRDDILNQMELLKTNLETILQFCLNEFRMLSQRYSLEAETIEPDEE